jgi:phospholipid/cholesterol/gamma-HCH transport system substrate-binding protein
VKRLQRKLTSIAIVITAASSFASCARSANTITVYGIFKDAGGLVAFSNVQSADVRIGRVQSISLDGYNAKVEMRIDRGANLPANVRAGIRSTSLLGEKFVELIPPETDSAQGHLSDGQVIPITRTQRVPGLDDVLQRLGSILKGGDVGDLGTFVHSAAAIVDGKQEALGQVFGELRKLTDTIAPRSDDIAAAASNLDAAFGALSSEPAALSSAVKSSSEASQILADQQKDLGRLVDSLSRFASAAATYSKATEPSSDRALKDLRLILDQVMTKTSDLEQSLSALSLFTDRWPAAIPGWYVQLDVIAENANKGPRAYGVSSSATSLSRGNHASSLPDLIWGATR